jgi:hypothetical protein
MILTTIDKIEQTLPLLAKPPRYNYEGYIYYNFIICSNKLWVLYYEGGIKDDYRYNGFWGLNTLLYPELKK